MLGVMAMAITATVCLFAALGFRRRFWGAGPIFYLSIVSLIVPGILLGLGISQFFQLLGLRLSWWMSGLGAHLSWTLPFGLLIMFAVFNRFPVEVEEAARDLGASPWGVFRHAVLELSREAPRSLLTVGGRNTLPIEISNMTTNVTTPALYAIGTVTSAVSFLVIAAAFVAIAVIQKQRSRAKGKTE